MTADASRSCLGLGACAGPTARQIVDARVLLTAAASPGLPGGSVSAGLLAPPCDVITRFPRSVRRRWQVPGNGPHKAGEFAGDRGGDHIGRLAGAGKLAIAGTKPGWRLSGDLADHLGLFLLAEQQLAADPCREAVAPGRLDQQPAGGAVSLLHRIAAGSYQITHCLVPGVRDPNRRQLARPTQPRQIGRVASTGLDPVACTLGDRRRSNHNAVVPVCRQPALNAITARSRLLSFRLSVKGSSAARTACNGHSPATMGSWHNCYIKGTYASLFGRAKGSGPAAA